jgi:tetratricopeptide (TPR) repeat protein
MGGGWGLGGLGMGGWGLGGLGMGGWGLGGLGMGGLGFGMPLFNAFPTWGMSTFNSWGLGSVANDWLFSDYTNPYFTTPVAAQPASTTIVFDYSQPIKVTAAPADPAVADSTEQIFSAARDRFKAGDYQGALDLTDQVLKQTPNAAVIHEFRALTLFALKRYEDAATVAYAVLSAGPGWNWATLIGLYPDVDTYTSQLRALEAYELANLNSSPAAFLLGYHYLVAGHDDAAAGQFERVTKLLPSDQLSASFVKMLRKSSELAAQAAAPAQAQAPAQTPAAVQAPATSAATASAPTRAQAQAQTQGQAQATQGGAAPEPGAAPPSPPPPPAAMAGTWKAQPAPEVSIALTLKEDGEFVWDVDTKGQKQKLEGQAGFQDGILILQQAQGPPLVGKVTQSEANRFVFAPPGAGDKGGGLVFTR